MSDNLAEGTILPCPFCGNEPTVMGSGEARRGLMIHCIGQNCPNPSVSYYNHAAARAVWNRRAAHSQGGNVTPPSPAESAKLRAALLEIEQTTIDHVAVKIARAALSRDEQR